MRNDVFSEKEHSSEAGAAPAGYHVAVQPQPAPAGVHNKATGAPGTRRDPPGDPPRLTSELCSNSLRTPYPCRRPGTIDPQPRRSYERSATQYVRGGRGGGSGVRSMEGGSD